MISATVAPLPRESILVTLALFDCFFVCLAILGLLAPASPLALTQAADFSGEVRRYRCSAVQLTNALLEGAVKSCIARKQWLWINDRPGLGVGNTSGLILLTFFVMMLLRRFDRAPGA
jgi:hypothetical protein